MAAVESLNGSAPRVAVVLPGGGARGAYEAGALSVLLPALEERGERVSIFCGTSVGAINAALFASLAEHSAETQANAALARWRDMRRNEVIARIVGPNLALTLGRLACEALEIPGVRLASLLDAAPLQRSLERWIDWMALHRNVKQGVVESVCIVATALSRGGPVAFVEGSRKLPGRRAAAEIRYVPTQLNGEHVRASAAIPLLFPPVEVTSPAEAQDHYIDGGTRLNSPLKPALSLGADRVIVIGMEPFGHAPVGAPLPLDPSLSDVIANVMDGLLVDAVGADLNRLAATNSFLVESAAAGASPGARAYRTARGRAPYRRISYALVSPERKGEIGELAERVHRERRGGLRGFLDPDSFVLGRILGGRSRSRGELLSFLLFDPVFVGELLELGRRDAERWLARHPRFWCSDAAHDFDLDPGHLATAREADALDEFRELRRR